MESSSLRECASRLHFSPGPEPNVDDEEREGSGTWKAWRMRTLFDEFVAIPYDLHKAILTVRVVPNLSPPVQVWSVASNPRDAFAYDLGMSLICFHIMPLFMRRVSMGALTLPPPTGNPYPDLITSPFHVLFKLILPGVRAWIELAKTHCARESTERSAEASTSMDNFQYNEGIALLEPMPHRNYDEAYNDHLWFRCKYAAEHPDAQVGVAKQHTLAPNVYLPKAFRDKPVAAPVIATEWLAQPGHLVLSSVTCAPAEHLRSGQMRSLATMREHLSWLGSQEATPLNSERQAIKKGIGNNVAAKEGELLRAFNQVVADYHAAAVQEKPAPNTMANILYMYWAYAQIVPYARGGGAIGEMLLHGLFAAHAIGVRLNLNTHPIMEAPTLSWRDFTRACWSATIPPGFDDPNAARYVPFIVELYCLRDGVQEHELSYFAAHLRDLGWPPLDSSGGGGGSAKEAVATQIVCH
jgi:hypothetical protein